MKKLYHRLLLLIAGSTQKELASQIRYLKIENGVQQFGFANLIFCCSAVLLRVSDSRLG